MHRRILLALMGLALAIPLAAETPKGSITIDRIAEIKTPSDATWSPDGKTVAFLWDAAGVQNLFAVHPGDSPKPLTTFPGNPDTLQNDIGAFVWTDVQNLAFVHEGQLSKVSLTSPASVIPGINDARDLTLSPDGK